jgi:hypothetical protein
VNNMLSIWRRIGIVLRIRLIMTLVVAAIIGGTYLLFLNHPPHPTNGSNYSIAGAATPEPTPAPTPAVQWTQYTTPSTDGTLAGFVYDIAATDVQVGNSVCVAPTANNQPCALVTVMVKNAMANKESYKIAAVDFQIALPQVLLNPADLPDPNNPNGVPPPLPGGYRLASTSNNQPPEDQGLAANEVESFTVSAGPLGTSTIPSDIELYFTGGNQDLLIPITR